MAGSDQHDGETDREHGSRYPAKDRERFAKPLRPGAPPTAPEAKLVQVTGSGLSGPFIRRPVMTVLLTLSVIVAGIATYNSTQGNTQFTLQFVLSKSIVDAATDVQAAIQRATGKLPLDLPSPPTFTKTNPNDQAVYLLGLLSDTLTDGDLYKYASTAVAQRIAILPGVSQVNIYGVQGAIRIKA